MTEKLKNADPFDVTEDYVRAVAEAMEHRTGNGTIKNVLLANREIQRRIAHDGDLEKWKDVCSFWIPGNILLDMLARVAWATINENFGCVSLVTFHPTPPDTEDSYFQVLDNDGDLKDSLPDAIKKAYFRLKDNQKEERRKQFLKLKEEFEGII